MFSNTLEKIWMELVTSKFTFYWMPGTVQDRPHIASYSTLSTHPRRQAFLPIDDDQAPERGSGLSEVTQQVRTRVRNQFCLQVVREPWGLSQPRFPPSQPPRLPQWPARGALLGRRSMLHEQGKRDHLLLHFIDKETEA